MLASGLTILASAPSLPLYLAGWAVIGFGMGAGLYDAAFSTLGALYGLEARRTITALTLFGGFASTVCWPLSAYLLAHLGWRGACLAYAGVQIAFSLPAYFFLLPSPDRAIASKKPFTRAPTPLVAPIERPSFVLLGASISLAALISTVLSVHLITVLQAGGLTLAASVALGAMVGPSQVSARLVEMLFGQNYHPIWTKLASTSLVTGGIALLFVGAPFLIPALIFYGCGIGLELIARGALPLALFGAEGYSARMGRLALPSLVAQAAAPLLGAILMQYGGSRLTLGAVLALAAVNVVLVLRFRAIMNRPEMGRLG